MYLTVTGGLYTLDADNGIALETKLNGPINVGDDSGSCSSPASVTTAAGCSGTWTYYTGGINIGTNGKRTVNIGNAEATTAVEIKAVTGDMALAVTSGNFNLVADTSASVDTKTSGPINIGTTPGVCDGD